MHHKLSSTNYFPTLIHNSQVDARLPVRNIDYGFCAGDLLLMYLLPESVEAGQVKVGVGVFNGYGDDPVV